jgi:hypothetical protein
VDGVGLDELMSAGRRVLRWPPWWSWHWTVKLYLVCWILWLSWFLFLLLGALES